MTKDNTQILQFGSGKFLRGFVDLFAQQAIDDGLEVWPITVVQSTGIERVAQLRLQDCRYAAYIRGFLGDEEIQDDIEVKSIGKALSAEHDWLEILDICRTVESIVITSNVTEAGYVLDKTSLDMTCCPKSFPAKLLSVLISRYKANLSNVTVVPCELIENNAHALLNVVIDQAKVWNVTKDCLDWIREDVVWLNTLVDRIVASPSYEYNSVQNNTLDVMTEPYALWAIQSTSQCGLPFEHDAIDMRNNLFEVTLCKLRILNGAHTALAQSVLCSNDFTVREALDNPATLQWVRDLLYSEIAPTLVDRAVDAIEFVDTTLSRLYNPYIAHKLSDIRLMHETKLRKRLLPTYYEYIDQNDQQPPILSELLRDLI
ncbi:MAG: altronate dehydrogenase [Anaerolineaceae bacterium]|nr:altronate dehydrogenase [Anaerolineaceae bacterium]|tara:strand:- start:9824 stop:10942 length:1119 start_codon:yes stop_codon:yes gene_type:complete